MVFSPQLQVLRLVSKAVNEHSYSTIKPVRSSSMEYALLQPPYRTFLNNSSSNGGSKLVVYNLPSSLTEYLSKACAEEAAYVRSCLYSASNAAGSTVVLTYDSNRGVFLGVPPDATEADLSSYVESNNGDFAGQLASATLDALSSLDAAAAAQLRPESRVGDVVVLLGSGGREHALAVALSGSPLVSKVICLPGNGGTETETGGKVCNATASDGTALTKCDNATVIELVKRVGAAMVVVGPEQPLVDGVVDELNAECPSVKVFGPSKAGAELEASKVSWSFFVARGRWLIKRK